MNFPRYWAKGIYTGKNSSGQEVTIEAYGWSSDSTEEARSVGRERAKRVVNRGFANKKCDEYEYGNTPFREEVTDSIEVDKREVAVISRNRYGSLVLNAADVMFVDIDFPEVQSTGIIDSILLAFSEKRRKDRADELRESTIQKIDDWAKKNPSKSFRLYRTHSGCRVLLTDAVYDPESEETKWILEELDSDRLYRSLTLRQQCFRARLTTKPWRCKHPKPPSSFPWEDRATEREYRKWEKEYLRSIKGYSTCILQKEYGRPCSEPKICSIIDYHDSFTLTSSDKLA